MIKKRGLGRGLNDLGINELLSGLTQAPASVVSTVANDGISKLPIHQLQPSRFQPRRVFDKQALNDLADSIRAQGMIQPIVVRSIGEDRYEIIAGERRWRAAKLAELTEVPVVNKEVSDEGALAMALIENIQREDLNAIEEAQALKRLHEQFNLTHEQVAQAVGKSRSMISNLLRLLQLHQLVQQAVQENKLEMGHARALLAIDPEQQWPLAQTIIEKQLSVRQTEELIRQQRPKAQTVKLPLNSSVKILEQRLQEKLGMKLQVRHQPSGKGKLVISYQRLSELGDLLERIA